MQLLVGFVLVVLTLPAYGRLLDPDSPANTLLDQLTPLLHAHAIDVARNLNAAASKPRKKPRSPRLGMLADIPAGSLVGSTELEHWEKSYRDQQIGAIVALPARLTSGSEEGFAEDWLKVGLAQRTFITYAVTDRASAQILVQQLHQLDFAVRLYPAANTPANSEGAPRFYATAGQRLVLDSRQARELESGALEIELLGKKLYRRSNSVFPANGRSSRYYHKGEPDRFRKADLGDNQVAATIPEIIVSGGIALGERANFQKRPVALAFQPNHSFQLQLDTGEVWQFPAQDPLMLKACFDFAVRSLNIESDAIIDIDERHRIRISEAFRNTNIGYELIGIDEQPFHYVDNLSAIKSVIIDISVGISATDTQAVFATEYEIRFINPDRHKLAETRVALVYEYDSATDTASFRDSWGPRAFRVNNVDYAALGAATRKVASVAGWAALFRAVEGSSIDFSRGRYEFLKIDNTGPPTPRSSYGG
ncbi:MAG: hypothetical protein O7F73_08020 [Gammaproteobacteria bacterium]|nr:hypothetical protein [Gammaproteobacteria bacterium]